MPFQPYHQFRNGTRLELLINDLHREGNIPENTFIDFSRYHQGLIQKLNSAKYYLENIKSFLSTTDITQVTTGHEAFIFLTNLYTDGFFYNSGSAFDILARIVLTLFNEACPSETYYETALRTLQANRPGDPILPRLKKPSWKQEFSQYRNTQTHEVLLLSTIKIQIDDFGNKPSQKIIIPLPNNPRALPRDRKYDQNPDVIEYMEINFRRILSVTNIIYGDIYCRASNAAFLPL